MSDEFTPRAMQLRDDLREALPRELILALCEFIAVSELGMPELARQDSVALRLATAREVLNVLGVSDRMIDTIKTRLAGSAERPASLRRH